MFEKLEQALRMNNDPDFLDKADAQGLSTAESMELYFSKNKHIFDDFRFEVMSYLLELLTEIEILYKAEKKKVVKKQLASFTRRFVNMSDEEIFDNIVLDGLDRNLETHPMLNEGAYSRSERRAIISTASKSLRTSSDFTRKFKIFEDDIIMRRRMEQNKKSPGFESKEPRKKTLASIVAGIGTPSSSYTAEQKIDRIRARLDTIFQRNITSKEIAELQAMREKLSRISSNEEQTLLLVERTAELINELLEAGIDEQEKVDLLPIISDETVPDNGKNSPELKYRNEEFISYLRYIRTRAITYSESSTRGGESIGDGNFIAHVWRPFLAIVENLLISHKINADLFSWSQVISLTYSGHDGLQNRVRLTSFLQLLKQYEDISDWKDNWKYITSGVINFSELDQFYIKKSGVRPLSNFLEKLEMNPPPID